MAGKRVGRPSKYNPEFHPKLVKALARLGYIDEQIAKELDITPETLYQWKKKYPVFSEALKAGKAEQDAQVESALLQRALGAVVDHVTKDGEVIKKRLPPDTVACIFWLKNRKPAEWRDRQHLEHGLEGNLLEQIAKIFSRNGSRDD